MTSIQAIKAQPAFTARKNDKENHYTGLKTGLAYTGVAGAAAYGVRKSVNPLTKFAANMTRKDIAQLRETIKNAKHDQIFASAFDEIPLANSMKKDAEKIIADGEKLINSAYKNMSELFKMRKGLKTTSLLKNFAMSAPIMIGMGLLTDIGNNYQRKIRRPNAVTAKGNAYTKVDMGKKTGFVNGAIAGAALAVLQKNTLKAIGTTPAIKIATIGLSAVGGFILGAITDKLANKQAAKAADKAAL